MKIIDQKGRLFGLMNIIDFSVIVVAISFVLILFFGYKALTKKEMENKDVRWVTIQIKLMDIEPEFGSVIMKGDTEKDPSGKIVGRLIGISSIKPSKVWVVVDNKMLSTIDHPIRKDMIVAADIMCSKRDGIFYYKTMPVKIGNTIVFGTDLYNVSGLIVGLKVDDTRQP